FSLARVEIARCPAWTTRRSKRAATPARIHPPTDDHSHLFVRRFPRGKGTAETRAQRPWLARYRTQTSFLFESRPTRPRSRGGRGSSLRLAADRSFRQRASRWFSRTHAARWDFLERLA